MKIHKETTQYVTIEKVKEKHKGSIFYYPGNPPTKISIFYKIKVQKSSKSNQKRVSVHIRLGVNASNDNNKAKGYVVTVDLKDKCSKFLSHVL